VGLFLFSALHTELCLASVSFALCLTSSARAKSQFRRRESHLYTTVSIGLDEALLGFERNLTHFDDHVISLKRNGVTQPGFVQTVPHEGMPLRNDEDRFGNLFVEYNVVLPNKVDGDFQKGD
jgi:DnaJ-related protein SCJ1